VIYATQRDREREIELAARRLSLKIWFIENDIYLDTLPFDVDSM